MPIVVNDTLEFPTCPTIIRPPIDVTDCTNFPTFNELVLSQELDAHGCTVRSGLGWAVKTVTEIETQCEAL